MDDLATTLIVLAGAAAGVALLVVFNALIGGWRQARIESLEAAAERLARDVIGFVPGADGALSREKTGALLWERGRARLGLIAARGDILIVRALRPDDIKGARAAGARLDLHLNDFTFPKVRLIFTDEPAQTWAEAIEAFRAGRHA